MKVEPLDIRCPVCGAKPEQLCVRNINDFYSHHQRRVKAAVACSKRKPRPWADGDVAPWEAWAKWSGHAVETIKGLPDFPRGPGGKGVQVGKAQVWLDRLEGRIE